MGPGSGHLQCRRGDDRGSFRGVEWDPDPVTGTSPGGVTVTDGWEHPDGPRRRAGGGSGSTTGGGGRRRAGSARSGRTSAPKGPGGGPASPSRRCRQRRSRGTGRSRAASPAARCGAEAALPRAWSATPSRSASPLNSAMATSPRSARGRLGQPPSQVTSPHSGLGGGAGPAVAFSGRPGAWLLAPPAALAVEDQLVGCRLEPVEGRLGPERIGHETQQFDQFPVGRGVSSPSPAGDVSPRSHLVEVGRGPPRSPLAVACRTRASTCVTACSSPRWRRRG